MALSKVWIEDGCTGCGLCGEICPDVFTVEDVAVVNKGSDFSSYEDQIKEAAGSCPVEVIRYE